MVLSVRQLMSAGPFFRFLSSPEFPSRHIRHSADDGRIVCVNFIRGTDDVWEYSDPGEVMMRSGAEIDRQEG